MQTPEQIQNVLESALTRLDARQSKRPGYNRYALGMYFNRVADIVADIRAGASPADAVCAGFTGSARVACLKALGLTEPEQTRSGAWHYVPASQRQP